MAEKVTEEPVLLYRRNLSDVVIDIVQDLAEEEVVVNASTVAVEPKAAVAASIEQQTDLIPGVYEGGMKTWECSMDLVHFLASPAGQPLLRKGSRIIEVRCIAMVPNSDTDVDA